MFKRRKPMLDFWDAVSMLVKGRPSDEVSKLADALDDERLTESIHRMVNEWNKDDSVAERCCDLIKRIEQRHSINRNLTVVNWVVVLAALVLIATAITILSHY